MKGSSTKNRKKKKEKQENIDKTQPCEDKTIKVQYVIFMSNPNYGKQIYI